MPETLEEIRAMVDPERYVRGLQEVLENYRGNLSRLLVDYDVISTDETLPPERRTASAKQTEAIMQTTAARIRTLEAKIEAVKGGNRAERRRGK